MDRRSLLKSSSLVPLGMAASTGAALAATKPAKPGQTAPASPETAVTVQAVQLPAWLNDQGTRKPLLPGTALKASQEVETASGGGLVLRLPDDSLIRIAESSRLGIQRLQTGIEAGQVQIQSQLKLYGGMFRYATSAISKVLGNRRIDLALRTATVGIRGTDFWCMTDEAHDAACLFEGKVDLATRDQGDLVLDKPTAFWARFFDKPVQPVGNATPQQLNTFLSSTELKPGTGVMVESGAWSVTLNTDTAANARQLAADLVQQGYPASPVAGKAAVVIRQLATRNDADGALAKLTALPAMKGRIQP